VAAREPVDPMPAVVERKLVTMLVCEVDKPAGDSNEPHSMHYRRSLTDPLARIRVEIAHHGGLTVRAVGNTVVAVFGVPRTREDDAERAVRTAVAIREALAGQSGPDREPALVWLRIAVATGEALINLSELRTGTGPGVTGDPVLMASAVNEAAPPGSIVATAATTEATERAISYAPPHLLPTSWSQEPIVVWDVLALRPYSRHAPAHPLGAALVGRQGELEVLMDHYAQVCADGRPQLLVLIGPAGIGKSRLVAEFGRRVTAGPIPPRWRAGRSHPYGPEGTSSALSEVVKAEAGILDTDPTVEAERKLAKAVSEVLQDPGTARWVTAQLNAFIGAGPDTSAGAEADVPAQLGDRSRQEKVFGAWRRFVQALASRGPLVLALEDLHWANDALLDLLASLIDTTFAQQTDRSGSIPILIVATARSDLLVRRPAWATSRPERTMLTLGPLPDADMASLLQALLVSHGLPATVNPELIEGVGGNPLFAEEYARMLRDRTLARPGSLRAALPIPSTVQRLIASRVDALPAGEKAVLQDAAVLGRTSWSSAIAAIGDHDKTDLEARLQALERKEFLHRVFRSRVASEVEVEFRHGVVCDLVYSQLPRLVRAERHRRAAGWIQQLAPGRLADRAELLAHHYGQALALARGAARADAELVERTAVSLSVAGDHAMSLGTYTAAAWYYSEALRLWPAQSLQRLDLEFRAGLARCYGEGRGEELLTGARDGLLAVGDRQRAAEAEMLLGQLAYFHGRSDRANHMDRAIALVADIPPSRSKALVLAGRALHLMVADQHAEAFGAAQDTLAMAQALGLRDVQARMLTVIGAAKIQDGDVGGIADLEHAITIGEDVGSPYLIAAQGNLAYAFAILGDLGSSFRLNDAARQSAERFGLPIFLRWMGLETTAEQYWTGQWDEALHVLDPLVADWVAPEPWPQHYLESACRVRQGRIRLARGQLELALQDSALALELARESGDPQNLGPALAFRARALVEAGRRDEADARIKEVLAGLPRALITPEVGIDLPVVLDRLNYHREVLNPGIPSRWLEAAQTFLDGELEQAARLYAQIGSRPDEAQARLEAAVHALNSGRRAEARAELARACDFFRQVAASAFLREAETVRAALSTQD
jgi:class 3 adenylate cyclase/tetratricopeptide (TPR) repeat protein